MSDHKYLLSFSNESFDDLNQIQTYTQLTFGIEQKIIYESKLKESFLKIAMMPSIGHAHKYLPGDFRVYNIEKHIVIYKIIEAESIVAILRIMHHKVSLADLFD